MGEAPLRPAEMREQTVYDGANKSVAAGQQGCLSRRCHLACCSNLLPQQL